MIRRMLITIAILITVFPLVGQAETVEEIVIKVNDSIVTRSEYESRLKSTIEGMKRGYKGPNMTARIKEVPQLLLNEIEDELLLVAKAKQLYQVNLIVDQRVKSFMKANHLKTKADLARALGQEGMTVAGFRRQVTLIYVPEFMKSREIRSRITISMPEIENYYNKHKAQFATKAQVKLQEILLLKKSYTKDEADILAKHILAEYKAGKKFGALAERFSEAFSRSKKGEAGWYQRSDLNSAIGAAVFSLKAGEVTKLIPTTAGWYLFRMQAVKKAGMPNLAKAQEAIVAALKNVKFKKAYQSYIKKLKAENYVWINPKYV